MTMSDTLVSVIDELVESKAGLPDGLDDAAALKLYRLMLTNRIMDERGMKLQRQGRIGFYLPSTGQEACSVGSAFALGEADWCFPSYREQGALLTLGAPLQAMVNQWYGNQADGTKGRQMPVHYSFREQRILSISSPIGTQISQAAGAAMAMQIRGERKVVLTYFGDGATSSNDFHAGLNFAAVRKAPCVFLCPNNQWAISCSLERQTASESIAIKAAAYGMPGVRVDGNDVLAVYQATRQAVERARDGSGPTLIEALTFRVGPHSSSDDPTRYRPDELVQSWRERDPIVRFGRLLRERGLLDDDLEQQMTGEIGSEVVAAVKQAEATPLPGTASIFDDVYAELPPHLEAQRQAILALEQETGAARADDEAAFPL